MRELEELTIEIIKKHLASNKKIGYDWDMKESYYVIRTGCFSKVQIGKTKGEKNMKNKKKIPEWYRKERY